MKVNMLVIYIWGKNKQTKKNSPLTSEKSTIAIKLVCL